MNDYSHDTRKFILGGAIILVLLVYVVRLFTLQVLSDEYKTKADSNAFYKKTIYPSRGLIYDRNGELLVYNQPAYDIMFVPREIKGKLDTLELCAALNITRDDFEKRMEDVRNPRSNPGYSVYTQQLFMSRLSA
jgi:penicillin-binding protein 2